MIAAEDLPGIWPEEAIQEIPGTQAFTPEEAADSLAPVVAESGQSVDVYSSDGADHVALVYPDQVNTGSGTDLVIALEQDQSGWSGSGPGYRASFPAELSGSSPVLVQIGDASLRIAPEGVNAPGEQTTPQSVTYRSALAHTDLVYELGPGGVRELATLKSPEASGTISYLVQVEGLTLIPNATGGIDLIGADGAAVGELPPALAHDSSSEPATTVGTTNLTDEGDGAYRLEVSLDPSFLEGATYPVIVDPGVVKEANRDAYVDLDFPTVSFESSNLLQVDSGERVFLRFPVTSLEVPDRIVYFATLGLWPYSGGGVPEGIGAKRPSGDWPPSDLTWNNQPDVDAGTFDTAYQADPDANGWWTWELKSLYQGYLDGSVPERGVRLSSTGTKTFWSAEGGATPYLSITYNDLPEAPVLDGPANDFEALSDAVRLSVKEKESGTNYWPQDPNSDEVLVSFQVSDDGQSWQGNHLVWQSPFTDDPSTVVPSGLLLDGQRYWWRAVSWDVCDEETGGMCLLEDGNGSDVELNATSVRSFTVSLNHFGFDPNWAMWSHGFGASMTGAVNLSNGNLVLDVPLDRLATPLGDLKIGLSYNSQDNSDLGLGPGWGLEAGPASSGRRFPTRLEKDPGDPNARVFFRGGGKVVFPKAEAGLYTQTSAGTGRVRRADDDTWYYQSPKGDHFVFDAAGALTKARTKGAVTSAGGQSFDYLFSGTHLQSVTDPLGRSVEVSWSSGRATRIRSWVGGADGAQDLDFDLGYDGQGRLEQITVQVEDPAAGSSRQERISFDYGSAGPSSDLIVEVRDPVVSAAAGTGWKIDYMADPGGTAESRVKTVKAPPGGGPTTTPTPWRFDYFGPYKGKAAAGACVADPRQDSLNCDPDYADDGPYERQFDLSYSALPLRITEPDVDPGGRAVTTKLWDTHQNLLCERSGPANEIEVSCTSDQDMDAQRLSRVNTYSSEAPFTLVSTKAPAPDPGEPRIKRTFAYDEGSGFDGLHVQMWGNEQLSGLPQDEAIWSDMDKDWGAGQPPGVDGDDTWSLRLQGFLDVSDWNTSKEVSFRVVSNDGVSLVVDSKLLLDCLGEAQSESEPNCGEQGQVRKRLSPGLHPIQIEYSELTHQARLKVQWKVGSAEYETIPSGKLAPGTNLLTTATTLRADPGSETQLHEQTWTYPDDDAIERHLPGREVVLDLPSGTELARTSWVYDSYGRVVSETEGIAGSGDQATTSYEYTDGNPAWGGPKVSCLTRITGPTGAVTDVRCDERGSTIRRVVNVRATQSQPAQERTTLHDLDTRGRGVQVTLPRGGRQITSYDRSGRVLSVSAEIDQDIFATTDYSYDHAGHLMQELAPDPDAGGPLGRPEVLHDWNWLDLETELTDERGMVTSYDYDEMGRLVSVTSPMGAVTQTTYRLSSTENQVVITDPAGVDLVKDFDVLGQVVAETLETLPATTYSYDVEGNLTLTIDPAGIRTETTYDDLSRPLTSSRFNGSAKVTTTYAYNGRGLLEEVDGPRGSDRVTFAYDDADRVVQVTQPGVEIAGSTDPVSVLVDYDDAGEQTRVRQGMNSTQTFTRTFTYDRDGNLDTLVDARGATSYTYDLAGWLERVQDPVNTVHFGYDDLGRQICRFTTACDQQTVGAETFGYDEAGNMTSAANFSASFQMVYDDDGRLWKTKKDTTLQTTYTYDPVTAQLTQISDPAGTTGFEYDGLGRIWKIDDPFYAAKTVYGYDSAGRLQTRTDNQANLAWVRTYESQTGRLDTLTIRNASTQGVLAAFDLGYDESSNVTSKVSTVTGNPSNGTWTYEYDGASRMTKATGPNASGQQTSTVYRYDGASNRYSVKVGSAGAVTTTYDDASHPVSSSDGTSYTVDAAGNLTKIDRSGTSYDWAFSYDAFSRQSCARQGSTCSGQGTITFTLDALDRVLSRTKDSEVTSYSYRGISEVVSKTVAGSTTMTYASSSSGTPLAQQKNGQGSSTRYFLSDPHGDLVALVSSSAASKGTVSFDPWGQRLSTSGTETSVLGFQSDLTDPDSGLVDMGTRHYVPSLGRFLTRDVLFGEPQNPTSLNMFAYAGANPITFVDPTGMRPVGCTDCTDWELQVSAEAYSTASSTTSGTDVSGALPAAHAAARAEVLAALTQSALSAIGGAFGSNDMLGSVLGGVSDHARSILDYALFGSIYAPLKSMDWLGGSRMVGWSTIRSFATSPQGRKTLRGLPVLGLVFFGWDVAERMKNDGNSLPRAVVEALPGAALSGLGLSGGCVVGAIATRNPIGCAAGGVLGAWGLGTAADQITDAVADAAVGPDLDG